MSDSDAAHGPHECRVCGVRGDHEVYSAREMMFGFRDRFDYFLCGECGCLQIAVVPADLGRYYPPGYYSYAPPDPAPATLKNRLRRLRNAHHHGRRSLLGAMLVRVAGPAPSLPWMKHTAVTASSRILDVGCGAGRLLATLHDLGFADLTGVDPFVAPGTCPRPGVRIVPCDLADLHETFDLIIFDRSFEHLTDPLETLVLAAQRLRPDGTVLIRVPLVPCYAWEHYGTDWVQLDAPRHIFIHSVESMRLAAERSGLRITAVDYDSTVFQFTGSEKHRRDIPSVEPAPPGLFTQEDVERFRRLAAALNAAGRGDQAWITLRHQT